MCHDAVEPGGFPAISRGLSEATPLVMTSSLSRPRQGSQRPAPRQAAAYHYRMPIEMAFRVLNIECFHDAQQVTKADADRMFHKIDGFYVAGVEFFPVMVQTLKPAGLVGHLDS